jgi:hypothetical protein
VQVREIDGTPCTDRAGMAIILDRALKTVELLGYEDPEFPAPMPTGERVGRDWRHQWTPLAAVFAYRDTLAARAEQQKPPPPQLTGDPTDLVDVAELAEIWHITLSTARRYVHRSRPQWLEQHPHPLVPVPDHGRWDTGTPKEWRWYRQTLTSHPRPGRGSSGGRAPRARKTT